MASSLDDVYRRYIRAILDHDLSNMSEFVSEDVIHNGNKLGLDGYKALLERNIVDTDMDIEIKRLIANETHVAAILVFTTKEHTRCIVGIQLDGKPFSYVENVIYDFVNGKIAEVHSLVDLDTIRTHGKSP